MGLHHPAQLRQRQGAGGGKAIFPPPKSGAVNASPVEKLRKADELLRCCHADSEGRYVFFHAALVGLLFFAVNCFLGLR